MDSSITGKSCTNVKLTGTLTVNNGTKIQVNGFQIEAEKPQKLKVTYNALEYELIDIDGHLIINRVYK